MRLPHMSFSEMTLSTHEFANYVSLLMYDKLSKIGFTFLIAQGSNLFVIVQCKFDVTNSFIKSSYDCYIMISQQSLMRFCIHTAQSLDSL